MKMLPLFFVLCSIAPAIAQSNSEIVYWPSATIKGYSPKLKSRQTDKNLTASEYLSDLGNYKFEIQRRDGSGGGEAHQNWTDIFVVQDGEATILYGGTLENQKDAGNGEMRGTRHIGGKSQKVSAGDILVIPPGVPHQTIVEPGKHFFTMIVKVERKQASQ
jgi:mannose-6-phosphate isomerase-like protein (cupin superfamily)